jgi:RNA polymerase sigma factor (TIGR02999 family)
MSDEKLRSKELTHWVTLAEQGDREADQRLTDTLYDELHRVAVQQMRSERRNHTLQPTALVHEACLRLLGAQEEGSSVFVQRAARAMRQVLIDHARRRGALKRGVQAAAEQEEVAGAIATEDGRVYVLLDLQQALQQLGAIDPRKRSIAELHLLGGLGLAEVGDALGFSIATIKREWGLARSWLAVRLGD